MAITGAHVLLYTSEPDAVRAIFRDVFGRKHVDAGHGWLIFRPFAGRAQGVRVVATRHVRSPVRSTFARGRPALEPGDSAIVGGPKAAVQRLADNGST